MGIMEVPTITITITSDKWYSILNKKYIFFNFIFLITFFVQSLIVIRQRQNHNRSTTVLFILKNGGLRTSLLLLTTIQSSEILQSSNFPRWETFCKKKLNQECPKNEKRHFSHLLQSRGRLMLLLLFWWRLKSFRATFLVLCHPFLV